MKIINKRSFAFVVIVWVILWIVFIFRENKPGQYSDLKYLYAHQNHEDKVRYLMGSELYDFIIFCKDNLSGKATYKLILNSCADPNFEEVRVRYLLWPFEEGKEGTDFIIYYKPSALQVDPGYKLFKQYNDYGFILIKEREK